MKQTFIKSVFVVLTALLFCAQVFCGGTEPKKRVVILATGGTIAGAGEFSQKFVEVIDGLKIPVAISSRVKEGIITQDAVLCKNTVAANDLSPQKAAILLRLALLNKTASQADLLRIFSEY